MNYLVGRQWLEKAIELDPSYAEAYSDLAMTYFIQWTSFDQQPGTYEKAVLLAEKSAELDASLPLAHSRLGFIYVHGGRYDEAIAAAERALQTDPSFALSYFHSGTILNLAGQPERAITTLKEGMSIDSDYPAYFPAELGHAYYLTARYGEAIAAFNEALNSFPDMVVANLQAAAVYIALNQQDKARSAVEEALRVSPELTVRGWAHVFPYKEADVRAQFLDRLRQAGLPE